jgi:phosphate-selective porin OprO/OprP
MKKIRLFPMIAAAGSALCILPHNSYGISIEERLEAMEKKIQGLESKLEKSEEENAKLRKQVEAQAAKPVTEPGVARETSKDIQTLDRKIATVDKKMETQKAATAEAAKKASKLELSGYGVTFKSADDNYKLSLRGYMQADGHFFVDHDPPGSFNDQFLLRRVRLSLDGTLFKYVYFRVSPDFAGSQTRLFDAFADLHYLTAASLAVGKMREPVSLERMQTAPHLTFIERAYPAVDVSPNRDVGLMLHGIVPYPGYTAEYTSQPTFKDFFLYEVGLFNGVRDNQAVQNSDLEVDNNKEVAARLFAHPFLHSGNPALEGLGLGIAGTYGQPKNNNQPSLVGPGQNTIVSFASNNQFASGESYRIYPQMYWYWGPFGLLGEYVMSSQQMLGTTAAKQTASARMRNGAWQTQLSYVLTGEKASFFGVKPDKIFDPFAGTWGALQAAARWTELDLGDGIYQNFGTVATPNYVFANPTQSVSHASTWSLGLNWFLNNNLKLMANYDQTSFQGGRAGPGGSILDRAMEKVFMTRLQVQF